MPTFLNLVKWRRRRRDFKLLTAALKKVLIGPIVICSRAPIWTQDRQCTISAGKNLAIISGVGQEH